MGLYCIFPEIAFSVNRQKTILQIHKKCHASRMDNRKQTNEHSPSDSQSQADVEYDDDILIKETSYDYDSEQTCDKKGFRGSENGKRDFDDVDCNPSVLDDDRTSLASITNAGASLISRRYYQRHKKMKHATNMEGLDIPGKNLRESPQQSFDTLQPSGNAFADLESLLNAQKEGYPENDSEAIYDSEGCSWDNEDVESKSNLNSITDLNIPTISLAVRTSTGSVRSSAEQVSEVASNLTHQPSDLLNASNHQKSFEDNGLTRETRGSFKSGDFTSQTTSYSNCVAGLSENPMPLMRNHKVSQKVKVTPVAKSIVGSR